MHEKFIRKQHYVRLYTYIFGAERSVCIQTDYSLQEIEADYELKTKLINEALAKESIPQSTPCEEWYA